MPISTTEEIELKFDATDANLDKFLEYCIKKRPTKYFEINGIDVYYQQGDNVVRHRYTDNTQELTVKKRKSQYNIFERKEVDLHVKRNSKEEIVEFLKMSGWSLLFSLKKKNHIFWIPGKDFSLVVAFYDVARTTSKSQIKRYIEVEVEKGSDIQPAQAKGEIKAFAEDLCKYLNISNEPIKNSLFELFSEDL